MHCCDLADDTGFTLVEMLIASAIMLTITAAVFTLINPAQGAFRAQPEASDMQQRLRVAVDALSKDLRMAGAGAYAGPAAGPLTDYIAPVLPYRIGEVDSDRPANVLFRPDAISVLSMPSSSPAQAVLADRLAPDGRTLPVPGLPNCPPPTAARLCGFAVNSRVLIVAPNGAHDAMTVTAVANPFLQVQYPGMLSRTYAAGTPIAEVSMATYYLKGSTAQLMRYDGFRSDLPLMDNVVKLEFQYFGEPQPPRLLPGKSLTDPFGPFTTYGPRPPAVTVNDPDDSWPAGENCAFAVQDDQHVPRLPLLAGGHDVVLAPEQLTDGPWCPDGEHVNRFDADLLRVHRIAVTLRVQVALTTLRGPAGLLFTHGGTATSAERYVPDLEIRFEITPRNMTLRR